MCKCQEVAAERSSCLQHTQCTAIESNTPVYPAPLGKGPLGPTCTAHTKAAWLASPPRTLLGALPNPGLSSLGLLHSEALPKAECIHPLGGRPVPEGNIRDCCQPGAKGLAPQQTAFTGAVTQPKHSDGALHKDLGASHKGRPHWPHFTTGQTEAPAAKGLGCWVPSVRHFKGAEHPPYPLCSAPLK